MYSTAEYAGYISRTGRAYAIEQAQLDQSAWEHQACQKNNSNVEIVVPPPPQPPPQPAPAPPSPQSQPVPPPPPVGRVVEGLKRDVERLKRDITDMQKENSETRASVTMLGDLMSGLQTQYNEMLKDHNDTIARNVELKRELDTLRAIVNHRAKRSRH